MFCSKSENPLPLELEKFRYLTETETAKLTGRGIQTLRNERSRKKGIPYVKAGKSVRYPLRAVLDYMESRLIDVED
jgi:hypothetical protein